MKLRPRVGLLAALAASMFGGCLGEAEEGGPASTPAGTARNQVQAILDRDYDTLERTFASSYMDFGGCKTLSRSEVLSHVRESAESEQFRRQASGKGPDDLLDWQKTRTGTYPAFRSDPDFDFFMKCSFAFRDGDTVFWAAAKEGSPFFDGWGGLYRKESAGWIEVGGD